MTMKILHIAEIQQWKEAQSTGFYYCDTLDSEGFIHCSTPEQVVATANRFFRGKPKLLLLLIDSEQVQAEIRYEGNDQEGYFPHIYGSLNTDAVFGVLNFESDQDGKFSQTPELTALTLKK
ncbi:MAG: DUF952 domain-containing protein [Spirulinaceae cyanobacterium]